MNKTGQGKINIYCIFKDVLRDLWVALIVGIAVSLLMFASCDKKPELLEIMPRFTGEAVTDIDYQFEKDDFTVYAIYAEGVTETIDDYEFEVVKTSGGYFHIKFTYGGMENYCYVECQYDIFAEKE